MAALRHAIARLLALLLPALAVLVGVATLVFLLLHLAPGDPVETMLGERASAADRAALREALGLDAPLPVQYLRYLRDLAHFDLGLSLHTREPVAATILERLPYTAILAVAALVCALVLALPLGLYGALRAGGLAETLTSVAAVLGMSLPSFVLGPLLMMVFAVWLGWLPIAAPGTVAGLVLPALTLGLALAALLARMVRATVREVLAEDYIRAARARGLSEARVLWRHALANAALPLLTVVGMQLGALLGGAVITEIVFGWPGLGALTIEAIQRRDYPLVQACVLVVSVSYVAINLATDALYGLCDPRTRTG
ncbi:MAG TPA: ABC transporter permease [Gammaproteobacteria bacterium]|nr:ABC transporter permease [Gammaproteobacteria bacterium]